MQDKIKEDHRHGAEFVAKVRPAYTLELLQKMCYLTFFKLLNECQEEVQEQIRRSKEKS